MDKNKNYYYILGLEKTCTQNEIKKSYRVLSKKYHPDVCQDDELKYMFSEVNEAYDVLYNEDTREEWDSKSRFGRNYDTENDLENFEFTNDSDQYSFYKEEFLKSAGDSINILLQLKVFQEEVTYTRLLMCNDCDSSGYDKSKLSECIVCKREGKSNSGRDCFVCSGKGFMESEDCEACYGEGKRNGLDCSFCKSTGKINLGICDCCEGKGRIKVKEILKLKLEDFKDNKLIVEGKGNSSKVIGGAMGNVYLKILD